MHCRRTRLNLTYPSLIVSTALLFCCLRTWSQRGEHSIDDEFVFSKHEGPGFFFMILGESSRVGRGTQDNLFDSSFEKGCWHEDCTRYGMARMGTRVFTLTTTDGHNPRYYVPKDNQRSLLDLKLYRKICPDQNGALLRTFLTLINTSL